MVKNIWEHVFEKKIKKFENDILMSTTWYHCKIINAATFT